MKRRFIPFALTLALMLGLGALVAGQGPDDAKFQKAMDSFLDEYWKFYPTAATLAGYHKYDSTLEDFSEGVLEKRTNSLDTFNQEFVSKINKANLSPDNQIDMDIIVDALEYDLFRHENLVPWEYNPLVYNEVIYNSVHGLLTRDFTSLDARAKNALERLKQLPGFIKQAKENLKTPAQIYTETAITQFPGIAKFYKEEVAKLVEGSSADTKAKINAELGKVNAALDDYQRFLSGTLLSKSTGSPNLGQQAHLRLIRLTTQGALILDELTARAKADYNNIRREMLLVCAPFYKVMYPEVNLEQMNRPQEEIRTIVIKGVLDKIQLEHPKRDEFVTRVKSLVEDLRPFMEKKGLIGAPSEMPTVVAIPPERQGLTLTLLNGPGAYETSNKWEIEVRPVPDGMPEDKAESLLREFNDFYLPFWTAARIYPGKFMPAYLARKTTSVVRRLFPNQPLLMGWSLGLCEQLPFAGYGNYDLRQRLSQLKQQLKAVIDFQLELNIHQANMSKEQAVAYWTRGGFVTEAEAERMYQQILLKPGEAAYTYIGMQEINDLEKEYKKLKGDAYNRKEFFEKILANGAIPMRLLKSKLQ
jgi:hypothetical protein